MRISHGLLTIIAHSGDQEAQAVLYSWNMEEAMQKLIMCFYDGDLDYFSLRIPSNDNPLT